ncbi:glycosyltransferase family 4 protein [Paenibacillus albicereus]|uniref:Glycosyltransferase family 4 protein n=1 Tax=Paenibacillus albicereus TaxID=2726185 RepID=A0A6H2GVI2_9BACL|nr:glycosyltransferase family 4 protein [Paenibacillus albicereus]QJC51405.1 glycosyltransferase family 4 protein [Paenibacillus albicereus]
MEFRPRLLFFSHIGSPEAITGAEKLLLSTVLELSSVADCTLAVPEEGILSGRAAAAGIPVRVTGHVPIYYSMYMGLPSVPDEVEEGTGSAAMEGVYRLLLDVRPHAVWVNTCVHPLPAIAAKRLGIPVVWCLTETMRPAAGGGPTMKLIEQHADRVIGISASTLRPLASPLAASRSEVLLPGVDTASFKPWTWAASRSVRRAELGLQERHVLVGFIASHLYENKGLEHFLAAAGLAAASRPDLRFVVIGNPVDAEYAARCSRIADASGLSARLAWLPFEPDVSRAYPAMDVLVVPSIVEEGFGMTALEGLLFGKPVVAYASGGLAEILHATGNADWLAPMADYAGLAERIGRLADNAPLRLAAGAHSGAAALAVFGMPAYRGRLLASLERLRLPRLPEPRLVHGSGPERGLLAGWTLRPIANPEAEAAAGLGGLARAALPDGVLALLPRGEPIGSPPPQPQPELEPPAAEPPAAAGDRAAGGRRRARLRRGKAGRARRRARPGRRSRAARRGRAGGAPRRRKSGSAGRRAGGKKR